MNLVSTLPYLNPVYVHRPVMFILSEFLKRSGLYFDKKLLHEKLTEHPYFPSLLSISDVLTQLDVKHRVIKTNLEQLKDSVDGPAFVHLNIQKGIYGIIKRINATEVKVLTENAETLLFTIENFLKSWDGVLLFLETGTGDRTRVYTGLYPGHIKYLFVVLAWTSSFLFLRHVFTSFTFPDGLHLLLSCSGLGVSWILVLQHLNKNNPLVQQLCNGKTNEGCSSVTASKEAGITGWLTMAEAGLMYFSGMIVLELLFPSSALSAILSLFIAPVFSLYAIFLQAFIIKKWCRLCMSIHTTVLLTFLVTAYASGLNFSVSISVVHELLVFLTAAFAWLPLKSLIMRLKDASYFTTEYKRLKSNPEIFKALLSRQPKVHIPEELKVFKAGNMGAGNELTIVSNPFCGPCAQAHAVLREWLEQGVEFKINFVFVHSTLESDKRRQFVEMLSSITDPVKFEAAVHEWFAQPEEKDLAAWSEKRSLRRVSLPYSEQVLTDWHEMAGVEGTPTFFINGHRLPTPFRLSDVRYLISEV